jgi:hypothetical protein
MSGWMIYVKAVIWLLLVNRFVNNSHRQLLTWFFIAIAFDVHLAETIVPVALGMPLLSAKRSQLFESLPTYVNLLGITHLGIVPSLIEATLNAATNGPGIALRYIASGGEKMSDAVRFIKELLLQMRN